MKYCILTQTASDISDYYKSFFKDADINFVTFKEKNPNAVDFLPKSTWSEGRNRLWKEVRGKYDYYIFIDDDLIFHKAIHSKIPQLHRLYQKFKNGDIRKSYNQCSSKFFFNRLEKSLAKFKPEVLTVKNLHNINNEILDTNALYYGSFSRRLGWFDAQFTVFSDYAAERILPYDTHVSGWSSAQILIYLLSHNIFKSKAISVLDIAVNNTFHTGAYVEDYKSNIDCKEMILQICNHTNQKFEELFDEKQNHVNLFYGKEIIIDSLRNKEIVLENYNDNFENSPIKGIEHLMPDNDLNFS